MLSEELGRVYKILEIAEESAEDFILDALRKEDEYILLATIPFVTSYKVLGLLAADSRPKIKTAVADNNYTPSEILTKLAEDTKPTRELLCSIASHPNTPTVTLIKLSKHTEPLVRKDAISNSCFPLDGLYAALDDVNILVRSAAVQMLQQRPDSPYYDYPARYLKELLTKVTQQASGNSSSLQNLTLPEQILLISPKR